MAHSIARQPKNVSCLRLAINVRVFREKSSVWNGCTGGGQATCVILSPVEAVSFVETFLLRTRYGIASRLRVRVYRGLGMIIGERCRLERVRVRRPRQVRLGRYNALTEGTWLWPEDADFDGVRIDIGDYNYFNRDVVLDACGLIKIGSYNMIGPGTFIIDSNHTVNADTWVHDNPMIVGQVVIGNGCWIGAHVAILSNVTLGDRCVVGAGSVVT